MKRKCLTFSLVILTLLVSTVPAGAKPIKNIVVIGWDGAQREHVHQMLEQNELPVLAALAREGKLIDIDVTDGATDTKAGWTQILTGYSAAITGTYSNARYQPIPEGYSVFERLEKYLGPENIDTVAVIAKKNHIGNAEPKKIPYARFERQQQKEQQADQKAPGLGNLTRNAQIIEEDGQKFAVLPGEPWYLAQNHMDLFVNGLNENKKVLERALEELKNRKDRRFFFFVHFYNPDHAGHQHGENSKEYSDGIKEDDACTGTLINTLKEYGIYDQTLVYVVVDHGFDEGAKGHKYAPYVFVGTNDPLINRDGDRMDIAPTLLKRMGVDLSDIKPALTGTPLDEPAKRKIAPAEKPAGFPFKDADTTAAQATPKRRRAAAAGAAAPKRNNAAGNRQKQAADTNP